MELNQDQIKAKDAIIDFILNSDDNIMVLTGFAGTGKTTTIKFIKDELQRLQELDSILGFTESTQWVFTATTNKAVGSLLQALDNSHDVSTIHSYLGLGMKDWKLQKIRKSKAKDGDIVVVDEASYIDNYLLSHIQHTKNVKFILVGDKDQLTPVKLTYCPAFNLTLNTVHLTKPMRQANAPKLARYCEELRKYIADPTNVEFPKITLSNEICHVDSQQFIDLISEVFVTKNTPTSKARVLCGTNKAVQEYNDYLFSSQTGRDHFIEGDIVLNNHFVKGIKTDAEVLIHSIKGELKTQNYTGLHMVLRDQISNALVQVCYPPDAKKVITMLETKYNQEEDRELKQQILEDSEIVADLRPNFACTVHKSQGSTFDEVFIDLNSFKFMARNPTQLARLLYVAISRARTKVTLTGDL